MVVVAEERAKSRRGMRYPDFARVNMRWGFSGGAMGIAWSGSGGRRRREGVAGGGLGWRTGLVGAGDGDGSRWG